MLYTLEETVQPSEFDNAQRIQMSGKNYAFDFDITLELNTPKLQVGSLRIHGRVESAAKK